MNDTGDPMFYVMNLMKCHTMFLPVMRVMRDVQSLT